jgi:hypothetical protein
MTDCYAVRGYDGIKRYVRSGRLDTAAQIAELQRRLQTGELTIEQFKTAMKKLAGANE